MAARWLDAATQQVELLSRHLSDLWSAALGLLTAELGPAWAVLFASLLGLLAVAACGGLLGGRRRPLGIRGAAKEGREVSVGKGDGAEEQRRKSRRRTAAKRAQMNGSTILEPQEHLSVASELLKQAPQTKTEKGKKNKKKAAAEVNARQSLSSSEGKEPEEGTWETKVSNREKRQQRRKDKEHSSEPEHPDGAETPVSTLVEHFTTTTTTTTTSKPASLKKSRGEDQACDKPGKGDAVIPQLPANWSKVHSHNGGDCPDIAVKFPSHVGSSLGDRPFPVMKTTMHKNPEPPTWRLAIEGTCSDIDERMKTDLHSVSFPGLRLNVAGTRCMAQPPPTKQWDREDYEWNDLYEMAAVDPGSDWNTPSELWGNSEQPQVENPAACWEPVAMTTKVSGEDKEKGESASAGSGKSKKKKKKRKTEDARTAQQHCCKAPDEPTRVELAKVEQSRRPASEKVHPPTPAVTEGRAEAPAVKPKKLSEKVAVTSEALQRLPESQSYMASIPLKQSGEEFDHPKPAQKKKKARRET